MMKPWCVAVMLAALSQTPACSVAEMNGQPARLVSAFFGLDDGLSFRANRFCIGAWGKTACPLYYRAPLTRKHSNRRTSGSLLNRVSKANHCA